MTESIMRIDLPTIWAGIVGVVVFLYLLLDGFDLGIGLLFPFFNREQTGDEPLDDGIGSPTFAMRRHCANCSARSGL